MTDDKEKLTQAQIDKIKAQIINSKIAKTGGSGSIPNENPVESKEPTFNQKSPVSNSLASNFSNFESNDSQTSSFVTVEQRQSQSDSLVNSFNNQQDSLANEFFDTDFSTTDQNDDDVNKPATDIFTKRDSPSTNGYSRVDAQVQTNQNIENVSVDDSVNSKRTIRDNNLVRRWLTPGRLMLAGIIGFFTLLIVGLFVWNQNKNNLEQTPIPEGYSVSGVYVDDAVPTTDFKYLKSQGVDFVYLKATIGNQSVGDNYLSRLKKAQKEDLQTGAVLVYNPDVPAYEQYNFLISQIGKNVGNLPIAIQVNASSVSDQDTQNALVELVTYISDNYTSGAVVKTTQSGIDILENIFEETDFWVVANDTKNNDSRNTLIQYNESNQIGSGVKAIKLPTSVYNGSEDEWDELIKGE